MDININETEGSLNILVSGEMNLLSIAMDKNKLMNAVRETEKDVVLDLEKCSYIDSSGIGLILNVLRLEEKKGKMLRLANVNENVKAILHTCSMDNIFHI